MGAVYTPAVPLDLAEWLPRFPVREHCLYLDHAGVAPLPARVAEAMRTTVSALEAGTVPAGDGPQEEELAVRALSGQLLSCSADDVSVVSSAPAGLSLLLRSIPWRKGDVVLLGAEEVAAIATPVLALQHQGVKVRRILTEGGRVTAETFAPLLGKSVRLAVLSWVAPHRGCVTAAAEVGRVARESGVPLVLDVSQGLGALPCTLRALGADAVVADGHRWLLGPRGTGLLVTRPELRHALRPAIAGWHNTGTAPDAPGTGPVEFPPDGRRFEAEAAPPVLLAGFAAALDLVVEADPAAIAERLGTLTRGLTHHLLEEGWAVESPGSGHATAGIVAARHPFLPPEEVVTRLRRRHIVAASIHKTVRFSPHFYVTAGEIDALRVILGKL